jgi:serine protease
VTAIPNDPAFNSQWSLRTPTENSFGINVPDAWSISTGSDVQVAVLDTGCAFETFSHFYANPDLDSLRIRPGWDFVNQDAHPNDDSNFGHGSHMCSLIGANTNNSFSAAGIAPDCILMPVKCFDLNGIGTADRIASGLSYASWFGARVILLGGATVERSQCLQDMIALAAARQALVIAGAGNNGANLNATPGVQHVYSQVMYVGATARNGAPAPYSNHGSLLSVSAPGGAEDTEGPVASTYSPYDAQVPQFAFRFDGSSVQPLHGTSVAAAHVAGVAALVIGALPGMPPAEVRAQIEATALPLGDPRFYGAGLVDATAAVGATTTPPDPGEGGGDGGGGEPEEFVDAAVTGLAPPATPVVMGSTVPVEVNVRNNGSTTQTITVTLQDDTNGIVIGSQNVGLTPGQSTAVAFSWTVLAPAATHTLRATATVLGDGNTGNNSSTAQVSVRAAQLQLRISPSKTNYIGGEWIFLTFSATDGGLPAPGTQFTYSILGANGYPVVRNATTITGPDGQVLVALTYYYSLGGRGTYLIEATGSRNGATTTARQTFTVTSARR